MGLQHSAHRMHASGRLCCSALIRASPALTLILTHIIALTAGRLQNMNENLKINPVIEQILDQR